MKAKTFSICPSLQAMRPEDQRGPSVETAHCLLWQSRPYSCLGLGDTEWAQPVLGPALSRHRQVSAHVFHEAHLGDCTSIQ